MTPLKKEVMYKICRRTYDLPGLLQANFMPVFEHWNSPRKGAH